MIMPECPSLNRLQEYLSDSLQEYDTQQIEEHLGMCELCVQLLEEQYQPLDFLNSSPKSEHPDGYKSDRVLPTDPGMIFLDQLKSSFPRQLPKRIGPYNVLRLLADGGTGEVYECIDARLHRRVAVKTIRPQMVKHRVLERLNQEARIQGLLSHENIVPLHDFGMNQDGIPYLVMEMIEGGTLGELLRKRPLAPKVAAKLLEACSLAVHYAHEKGVLHRDLKPSNILIANQRFGRFADGELGERANLVPKITDFGLAKLFDNDTQLTQTGTVLGTPTYMSPEQASGGSGLLGEESDVYALGVILYECLTGRPPFQSDSVTITLRMIQENVPVSPRILLPGLSKDLETICLKCLEKEPSQRYQSAYALANDLQNFLKGNPIHARPLSVFAKSWRWCRRNRYLAAAIIVTVTSLVSLSAGVIAFAYVQADLLQRATSNGQMAIKKATQAELAENEARRQRDMARSQFEASSHVLHNIGNMLVLSKIKPDPHLKELNQQFQKEVLVLSQDYLKRSDLHTDSPEILTLSIFNAARANDDLGQYAEAIRLYTWLLELLEKTPLPNPESESYRYLATNAALALAELHDSQKKPEMAIAVLEPLWRNPCLPPFGQSQNFADPGVKRIQILAGSKLQKLYIKTKQLEKANRIGMELETLKLSIYPSTLNGS